MGARFVQEGDSLDYRPAADVVAGEVVVQADLVGVAKRDIKAGDLGALAVAGVFEFPKDPVDVAAGARVFWNPATKLATLDATQAFLGKAVKPVAAAEAKVVVRLSQ